MLRRVKQTGWDIFGILRLSPDAMDYHTLPLELGKKPLEYECDTDVARKLSTKSEMHANFSFIAVHGCQCIRIHSHELSLTVCDMILNYMDIIKIIW